MNIYEAHVCIYIYIRYIYEGGGAMKPPKNPDYGICNHIREGGAYMKAVLAVSPVMASRTYMNLYMEPVGK